jgi:hypothetical protein
MRTIDTKGPFVAAYRASRGKAFVRISAHGKSLHINIAAPGYFDKGTPTVDYTIKALNGILARVAGEEVPVRVGGVWRMPVGALPADGLVRSFLDSRKVGKLSLSLIEGRLRIKGSSLRILRWEFDEEKGTVEIGLQGRAKTKFGEDYFVGGLKYAETAFDTFVLGKD